jgi:phage-related protein
MLNKQQKLNVIFFRTKAGKEPVREWLIGLTKAEKKVIGEDIKTVQFGWPLGMPLVGSLGQGIWEVRVKLPSNKIARIIFFMDDNTMVLVNGFIKKTQKTPKSELDLSKQRKRQYLAIN